MIQSISLLKLNKNYIFNFYKLLVLLIIFIQFISRTSIEQRSRPKYINLYGYIGVIDLDWIGHPVLLK